MNKPLTFGGTWMAAARMCTMLLLCLAYFGLAEAQAQNADEDYSTLPGGSVTASQSTSFRSGEDATIRVKAHVTQINAQPSTNQPEIETQIAVVTLYYSGIINAISAGQSPQVAFADSIDELQVVLNRYQPAFWPDAVLVRQNLLSLLTF